MKGTFKLFTLAVAVAALASCSNDDFERATFRADKAELTGTLGFAKGTTRSGMQEAAGYGSEEIVWTKGDKARVFTLKQLTYNAYNLVGGFNTQVGRFESESGNVLSGEKYAVTDASMVYALSADNEARPLLTMTIPSSYEVDQELMGEGIYKFPAPFWGKVNQETKNDDGTYNLSVTFMPLIAYLRVDLANLPVGTKAIVLTTHGGESHPSQFVEGGGEGYQLFDPNDPATISFGPATATYEQWMNAYRFGGNWVTGGASEPLSGTLNAVLSDEDFVTDWEDPAYDPTTWPVLGFDERLVSRDTLRIDLAKIQAIEDQYGRWSTKNGDQIFWVPVVAQYYKNLHVIAVTQDSPLSYQWVGKELKSWSDQTFVCNDIWDLAQKNLDLNEYKKYFDNIDAPKASELSNVLYLEALKLQDEGIGRTLTVDVPTIEFDTPLYIEREIADNDLIIKLNGITTTGLNKPVIQEAHVDADNITVLPNGTQRFSWLVSMEEAPSNAMRTLTIQNTGDYFTSVDLGTKEFVVNAPSSKVVLEGNDFNASVYVRAANSKYVSGHALVPGSNHLQNATDGALLVKTSIYDLHYGNYKYIGAEEIASYAESAHPGDIYIYPGGNEEPLITYLSIYGATAGGKELAIRLTDALVENMRFPINQNEARHIYTTGSSAIKNIYFRVNGQDVLSSNDASYSDPTMNNVHIFGYWTGAALTEKALGLGFDCGTIYTAAQLASMGEDGEGKYLGMKKYVVDKHVYRIWLGSFTYPWIGPEVDVEDFEFDGKDKLLVNMVLDTNDATFIDPHHCCTSCGPVNKIKLTENLGLIRSIINTSSADIKHANLNDVYLKTDARIDNIGSLVGLIRTGELDMEDNKIGEVKIDVNGYNVGGMVGNIITTDDVDLLNNTVGGSVNESGYVISDLSFVGGQVGNILSEGNITIEGAVVEFDDKDLKEGAYPEYPARIYGGGKSAAELNAESDEVNYIPSDDQNAANVPLSFVGGIVGNAANNPEKIKDIYITSSSVKVTGDIQGRGSYVGGLAGNLAAADDAYIGAYDNASEDDVDEITYKRADLKEEGNTVDANKVESVKGSFVGGAVGFVSADEEDDGYGVIEGNTIKLAELRAGTEYNGKTVDEELKLQGSFAGGLVGYLRTNEGYCYANDVEVDALRASGKNAAGLIAVSDITYYDGDLNMADNTVKGTTFRADEGFVGGLVATIQGGETYIGTAQGKKDGPQYPTKVSVANMKGAYAIGGLVGNNQCNLWIEASNEYDPITVDKITFGAAWKTRDWYTQDYTHQTYAGTMANVLGYLHAPLDIHLKDKNAKTYLSVQEIKDDNKKNVFYDAHVDEQHTIATGLLYWGDKNYFVGWGNSGMYKINGDVWTDQNWNLYKKY